MNIAIVDPKFIDKAWRDGASCLAEACATVDEIKTCNKCNTEKPISHFYKNNRLRDGHENTCKSCRREAGTAWYKKNAVKHNERCKERQKSNPDRQRENVAAWRMANPDRSRAIDAAWRAANPDKVRIKARNRRAKKRAAGGTLSMGLTKRLFKLQRGKCACCGEPLGASYHLDHIMPLALGGSNTDDNIQLLRAKCNLQKSAKHPVDFMQERGLLL